jgi:lytic murein transglycosylase
MAARSSTARLRLAPDAQPHVSSLSQVLRLAFIAALISAGVGLSMKPHAARAAPAKAEAVKIDAAAFGAFLESLWPLAQAAGVSRATFDAALANAAPVPSILARARKQSEFTSTIRAYVGAAVTATRVARGQGLARLHSEALARAERATGVDRFTILAIWGTETNYGVETGGEQVVSALATLAFARYRGDYFRDELIAALKILEDGHVTPAAMRGSWAGAMGQTQFMPSSFLRHAVDADGDGRADIWSSPTDALASAASFLAHHGWAAGAPWGYEVALPAGFQLAPDDQERYRPVGEWAGRGVARADGAPLAEGAEARLLLPAGRAGPVFLVTRNFTVIRSYNNSMFYALAVGLLSDRLAGRAPLVGRWPQERAIAVTQARDLQRELHRRGYDVGALDGKLGDKVRAAIRDWQARQGVTPDGHPTLALLEQMRKAP